MKDIVVIIPVHEISDDVRELLPRAIKSVPKGMEIRVSCANGLSEGLKEIIGNNKNVVLYEDENENSGNGFQKLVNQAVGESNWFTILEFDDEFTEIWLNNALKYIDFKPEISVLMCMEDMFDDKGEYIGIGNDAPWASSFSNELGYIDNDCLNDYFDFYMTGSLFNTSDWETCGGLKESMKVTFWYEFMLRLTQMGKQIFVMPKVGYKHMLGRKGSLIEIYKETISDEEGQWWFDLARQEYFFKEDRNKAYQPEEK